MNNCAERLRKYRTDIKEFKTKREMAKFLEVSEDVYAKAENGTREPSKTLLKQLEIKTQLSAEYWLYGIEPNHINKSELSSTLNLLEKLLKDGDIALEKPLTPQIEDLLITTLRADIKQLLFNRSKK